jgi:hypothetical protein
MAKAAADMIGNWQKAMQNPMTADKYRKGIGRTTVNPMQLAASPQAMQLYLARVQQSVQSGKRANKLNAVPVQRWKDNATNVGANNLSSGATKALDKVTAHFNKWAPIYQQASDAARAVPKDGTIGAAMARVQANLQVLMAAAGH